MASRKQFLSSSVLSFLIVISLIQTCLGGEIATYWGQMNTEGTLRDACATQRYQYVMIAFLSTYGNGRAPQLNLAGRQLSDGDIAFCQSLGIKVLLSLGGGINNYTLTSTQDARDLANYLWDNFLGGTSPSRPIGSDVVDGVDFDIENGETKFYADLARFLDEFRRGGNRKVYLSAAPQCPFPDAHLGEAIRTGLFDFVWVQFYNNPVCEYKVSPPDFEAAWTKWTTMSGAKTVFLGLPAAPDAANNGFIPPDELKTEVLPLIKPLPNYGGVMLWSRFYDGKSGYSTEIKGSV